MKATFAILLLAFVATATANRALLQSAGANLTATGTPAPAPAPTSCPAKQSPAATCIAEATAFQTTCSGFIAALNSATSGQVTATTDEAITGLVAQLKAAGQSPSAACCPVAITLFSHACACDTTVQAVAKAKQNLTPAEFQTVGKVFLNACGKPACTDTCLLSA